MPANDNTVKVMIVGDASGVQPAVEVAGDSIASLQPLLADLSAQMATLSKTMQDGFAAGAMGGHALAGSMAEAKVATEAEGNAMLGLVAKVHEGAEAVRTFQMRAKEFAELYVAMFGAEAVAHWAESMGEAAEKTAHLAAETGMTTGQIQGLSGAATLSGTNIDMLTKGLAMMANRSVTVTSATTSSAKALKAMGIDANDGTTNMQRLLTIADKFHAMAGGSQKAALAMQLFGRSGREMIPFLNQGSEALQGLIDKAKEYGVVNDAAQAQGERLAESVNTTKIAWEGLKNTLTQAFGPILTELMDGFSALVKAMHDSYEAGGVVKVMFDALGAVIEGIIEIVNAIGDAFGEMFGSTGTSGLDWSKIIKTAVDVVVLAIRLAIATVVMIADAFKIAFLIAAAAVETFVADFTQWCGGIKIQAQSLGEYLETVGKVIWDALHLDWGAIKSDWDAGMEQVRQTVQQKADQILAITGQMRKQAQDDLASVANIQSSFDNYIKGINGPLGPKHDATKINFGGGTGKPPDIKSTGKGKKPKKAKDDLVQQLEEELNAKKDAWNEEQLAQGTAQAYSLQSIADYWAKALQITNMSAKDRQKIEEKHIAAAQAVQKQEIEAKLEGYKEDLKRAGNNAAEKLKILQNEQAYIVKMYGAQSKEARAASDAVIAAKEAEAKQVREIQDEIAKHEQQLATLAVDQAEADAKFRVEMGLETKGQLLAQEKNFENQRYQIKAQALEKEKALIDPNRDPVKYQQICDQIEQLERQHQNKLTQIDQQAILQRSTIERNAINQVSQGWADQISKLVTLQQGFTATLKGLYQSLQQTFASVIQSMLEKFIAAELTKIIYGKTTTQSTIAGEAAKAGAGGTASMAAAPWPLDMTAPAFGASMSAAAAAFGSISMAEGGDWNVKEGLYGLHKNEMVLPAWAAQPLRDMIGGAASGRSAANLNAPSAANDGGDIHFHFPGTVIGDSAAMERWARHNRHMFGAGVKSYIRNGGSTDPTR